jgi:hypothetical protein
LFTAPSGLFLYVFEPETFLLWFNLPVQVLRAVCATFAAIFIIRRTRSFEAEKVKPVGRWKLLNWQSVNACKSCAKNYCTALCRREFERQRIALSCMMH